jgi:riboflavin kinase/FMN adenylyltransferase
MEREKLEKLYAFTGKVVYGRQLGRTIGFPTANLEVKRPAEAKLPFGVYGIYAEWGGRKYKGMMNYGLKPTFDINKIEVEVNLFDFEGNLYGEELQVNVEFFVRQQIKFPGIEELKQQLQHDRQTIEQMFLSH